MQEVVSIHPNRKDSHPMMRTRFPLRAGLLVAATTLFVAPAQAEQTDPRAERLRAHEEGVRDILTSNPPMRGRNPVANLSEANPARAALAEQIHEFFEDDRFSNAFWGALVYSPTTGEVWYERHPDQFFIPASNQKAITTAAALGALGPDWRFTTTFYTDGEIDGDTLKGNLVVYGNGDPTLYGSSGPFRFFEDSRDKFREIAGELREMGIRRIEGHVVGDDRAFDEWNIDPTWVVSNLPNWPAAEFGPVQVNEGYMDVRVYPPDSIEENVRIEPNIPTSYVTIVDEVRVVEEGRTSLSITRELGTNTITVSGTAVVGSSSVQRSPSITNPTLFYATVLMETLNEEGIKVVGSPHGIRDLKGWSKSHDDMTELLSFQSPPLSDVLKGLMKRSQNLYAETLVKTMGYEATGLGTFASGSRVVQEELEKLGIDSDGYLFRDGSGLSRYNLVSPRTLVDIYAAMAESEHAELWYDIQPLAGVDGTLSSRMRNTPAEGNVRAKTGTVANTRGLSGYVTTADGEELVFSFLVNSHTTTTGATNDVTDGVLALLAAYSEE